jgi:small subunit ribosomal protein S5
VGDAAGHVGFGIGKAKEVPEAIRKGADRARKTMLAVRSPKARSLTRSPALRCRPRAAQTGGRRNRSDRGGGVRAVVELAGVENLLTKSLGSDNPHNVVKATMDALSQLVRPEEIASTRGKQLAELR